jgi:hypothetical protein
MKRERSLVPNHVSFFKKKNFFCLSHALYIELIVFLNQIMCMIDYINFFKKNRLKNWKLNYFIKIKLTKLKI